MKKRSTLYRALYNIDVDVNEDLGGNYKQTISRQTATGIRRRKPHLNHKEAVDTAHGNMLAAGGSIAAGASIIEENPLFGTLLLGYGFFKSIQTIDDWQKGDWDF